MSEEKRMCPNPEFEGEEYHWQYCMNCDEIYGCDEEHKCDTHCINIVIKEEKSLPPKYLRLCKCPKISGSNKKEQLICRDCGSELEYLPRKET